MGWRPICSEVHGTGPVPRLTALAFAPLDAILGIKRCLCVAPQSQAPRIIREDFLP